jgi:hypothetical protein
MKKFSKRNSVIITGFAGLLLMTSSLSVKADNAYYIDETQRQGGQGFEPAENKKVEGTGNSADSGVEIERLEPWVGNKQGQKTDETRSFIIVDCFTNGIISVKGNLAHSNQINQKFKVSTVLNDVPPTKDNNTTFATNNVGDGEFEFNFNGAIPGIHTLLVKIESDTIRGGSLFVNESANNANAAPGILFTCPGSADEDPYQEEGSDT